MTTGTLFSALITFVLLFALSAFFSASETAFSSVNKIRLRRFVEEERPGASSAMELAKDFNRTVSAILIGGNIVDILITSAATAVLTSMFGPIGAVYATVLMTILIILFGEILPKALVKDRAEPFALASAPMVKFFVSVLNPVCALTSRITSALRHGRTGGTLIPTVTHDELLSIVDTMGGEGTLPLSERELVENAVNFNGLEVWEVQTPRVDLFAIEVDDDPSVVTGLIVANHYSRIPVYQGSIDNIVGILYEKDYLATVTSGKKPVIRDMMKRPILIAGSASLMDSLKILRSSHTHMAVVLDEYGGTSGIVTLEDLLEELVGELYDEHDDIKENVTKIEENVYMANGDIYIKRLFEAFLDVPYEPETDATTLSGWLLEQFKTLPETGAEVKWENFSFQVSKLSGQRIHKVRITRKP
ncbi:MULTISPECIES: hemolysin family protein [Dethiosulfovibrio]|uniref:Hemolysin family protein n=2 Tax=Dethiosulfovibrio TaxID=47054 RepID=A0ABS9EQ15_9BACT|nr:MULTISPECIES: hemolysin family protein [Dethiosulfovibrio]MCF4114868.1 hemolysin family protein [Dethiosulfovibrio russensis]MCF4143265.1 hemolysin family protein [Dethiosulfovibrio marinus]MCF4146162.1 hemolysin family protein [Dethiosulfovibrio acidaminovorans]